MRDEKMIESVSKESEIDRSKVSRLRYPNITGSKKKSEECRVSLPESHSDTNPETKLKHQDTV